MAIVTTFFTQSERTRGRTMAEDAWQKLVLFRVSILWLLASQGVVLAVQLASPPTQTNHVPSVSHRSQVFTSRRSSLSFLPPADAVRVNVSQLLQAPSWWDTLSSTLFVSQDRVVLPPAMVNLRKLVQQAEERLADEITPRLVSINRGARFRGEDNEEDFKRRAGRGSAPAPKSSMENEIFQAEQEESFDADSEDYHFHPVFGPLLSRLDGYFQLLRIPHPACQLKLICWTSTTSQDQYSPLSDLFLTAIKRSKGVSRPTHYHKALRRYFDFRWASEKGAKLDCDEEYAECPASLDQLVNLPVLRVWQTMAKKLAIQLQDE